MTDQELIQQLKSILAELLKRDYQITCEEYVVSGVGSTSNEDKTIELYGSP
jgi:hypothetical protein